MSRVLAHVRKPDHATFLLALVLVCTNVVLADWRVSAAAATFLIAALSYDAWEVYAGRES